MYNYRNGKGRQPAGVIAQIRDTALQPFNILGMLLVAMAIVMPGSSHAAPLNTLALPGSPLVDTNNAFIDYSFTAGVGGTLTVTGLGGGPVAQSLVAPLSWGISTVANPSVPIVNPGAVSDYFGHLFGGTLFDTTYSLTANFDQFGAFIGGNYAITGVVDIDTASGVQFAPQFDPLGDCGPTCSQGGLMSGELLAFGFVGTPTDGGLQDNLLLEFNTSVTGGDFFHAGFANSVIRPDVGIVMAGDVVWGTSDPNANSVFGDPLGWDPDEINDMTAFTDSFVSCTGCPLELKTFVPVPAAVWLFGSGLFGLIGVAVRNRRRS